MTPLVDVMLVLLIIFIVTAPLMTQAIKVDLPQVNAAALDQKPETIRLSVKANGEIYWNDAVISADQLKGRMEAAAKVEPQPEVHMSADKAAKYETIAEVMGAAREAGLAKFGFVTSPSSKR
jgi:biopolymer transport protein ExbD